jgi:5-methylthioribose kinase
VEKYDTIAAPEDRILMEAAFYEAVGSHPAVASRMPQLLGLDRDARCMVLSDLGRANDLTPLYAGDRLTAAELGALIDYLAELHEIRSPAITSFPENREMRVLNHEHIFRYPFVRSDGPSELGARLKADDEYRRRVEALGRIFLSPGTSLVHGDFYPGSWMRTSHGIRVLDPEFAFVGPPELDLGVLLAHLLLSEQQAELVEACWESYRGRRAFDEELALGIAGVEIMRRLLGVAQLPLRADARQKEEWLQRSRRLVLKPSLTGLISPSDRA